MGTRRRHWMLRWAWLVALCAVLGLMTSVGVAWGVLWNWPERWSHTTPGAISAPTSVVHPDAGPLWWNVWRTWTPSVSVVMAAWVSTARQDNLGGYPATLVEYQRWMENPACKDACLRVIAQLRSRDFWAAHFTVISSGWPVQCMASVRVSNRDSLHGLASRGWASPNDYDPAVIDPAFDIAPHYYGIAVGECLLPLRPLWIGLLANTAFYGGAWAVLIFTPLVVRRWLRARKGGCAGCGYSREGLKDGAPCPECGRTPPAAHDATPTSAAR